MRRLILLLVYRMLRTTWQNVEEIVEMSPTIRVWFKKQGLKKNSEPITIILTAKSHNLQFQRSKNSRLHKKTHVHTPLKYS